MPEIGSEYDVPPGSAYNENSVQPGKRLGLLPDQGRRSLSLGAHLNLEAALQIPVAADHISGVPGWNLGANNRFGTCGPTSLANYMTMAYWALLGEHVTVTDEAVFNLYRTCNPDFDPITGAGDRGVDMNQLLNNSLDVGLDITRASGAVENVKPVAFGRLEVQSIDHLRAATAVFGGIEAGVTLMASQQEQTAQHLWDYVPGDSNVWGGHAIMGAAYTGDSAQGNGDEEFITWAQPCSTTDAFLDNQLQQAYGVILPIHLTHPNFLQGVDVSGLAAEYQELTGRSFPA